MKNISKYVSYKEGVHSNTAIRKGLDNTPTQDQLEGMKITAEEVFEPLRAWVGNKVKVNSFFRSPKVNESVGGSSSSQHCKGQAIDVDDTFGYKTNAEMFEWIRGNLDFDQMIWEFGDDDNPNWVHISYVGKLSNRNRCLRTYTKANGRTGYKVM
jgi:zinc D-Ala-D-Ala carboxypeptidase